MSTVASSDPPAPIAARHAAVNVDGIPIERPATARRSRRGWVALALIVVWSAIVIAAAVSPPLRRVHPYALFAHLVFLAIGFGAVLAVELHGAGFVVRLVPLRRAVEVGLALDPLIWFGLAGLAASGFLLHPDLHRPLVLIKLGLVLVVGLNGLRAHRLAHDLRGIASGSNGGAVKVPLRMLARAASVSLVSQAGWWGAVVIGFLSTNPT